jgi:hypothetical protein
MIGRLVLHATASLHAYSSLSGLYSDASSGSSTMVHLGVHTKDKALLIATIVGVSRLVERGATRVAEVQVRLSCAAQVYTQSFLCLEQSLESMAGDAGESFTGDAGFAVG